MECAEIEEAGGDRDVCFLHRSKSEFFSLFLFDESLAEKDCYLENSKAKICRK